MKKRVLTILLILLSILIVVPISAYSIFSFIEINENIDKTINSNKDSNNNHTGIDDIKENYTGIGDESKEYTIYFFPSVLYTQYYYNYLTNTNYLVNLFNYNNVTPENWFGYNEITRNSDGSYTSSVQINNDNTSLGDLGYLTYIQNEYDQYRNNSTNQNLATREKIAATYVQYEASDYLNGASYNGMDDYHYSWDYKARNFGDPLDDVLDIYFNPTKNFKNGAGERQTYKGQFNYNNIYLQDRFGFWPSRRVNINNNSILGNGFEGGVINDFGRYLPIKITFNDSLPVEIYEEIIEQPKSNMGDRLVDVNQGNKKMTWYNFSFAGWGYFDTSNNFTVVPVNDNNNSNYIEGAFTSYDVDGLFDIMQDLDTYDSDGDGIIRLFPVFTNGKEYNATKLESGGRDSFKLTFNNGPTNYVDNGNVIQLNENYQIDNYFLYDVNNTNEEVQTARILNFRFDEDLYNEISLKAAFVFYKDVETGIFDIDHWSNRNNLDWSGRWLPDLQGEFPGNRELFLYNKVDGTNVFSKGEGLYNIYVFNHSLLQYNNDDPRDYSASNFDYERIARTLYPNKGIEFVKFNNQNTVLQYQEGDNGEDHLYFDGYMGDTALSDRASFSQGCYYVLGIEKISEVKFIEGIDSSKDIVPQIENKYETSTSMLKQDNSAYFVENAFQNTYVLNNGSGNTSSSNDEMFTFGEGLEEGHMVISDFAYSKISLDNKLTTDNLINKENLYIIRNIDFTNYLTLSTSGFQIKVFKEDDTSVKFNFSDPYAVNSDHPGLLDESLFTNAIIYDYDNTSGDLESNNVFIPAAYFFEIKESIDHQYYYQPLHSAYFGMYDFILYFDGSNYELYCNRHYNVNVKIYSENATHNSDGYAYITDDKLIWNRRTFVGSYANISDIGLGGTQINTYLDQNITFENAIKTYLTGKIQAGETYYIRDHVTGIGFFKASLDENNEIIIERMVDSFRIRKNYLLYVTNEPPINRGN